MKSGASGTWTNAIANNTGGDGNIFSSSVQIDQNDWTVVPVSTSTVYVFRRNGSAVEGASYLSGTLPSGNKWAALSAQPPAFTGGQAFKPGAGLFGATDGTNVWLFVINTDGFNSILYT